MIKAHLQMTADHYISDRQQSDHQPDPEDALPHAKLSLGILASSG
jgi:hypothetical protein